MPFTDHAMQHIDDESRPFFNVGTQKPLWQGKEMCISSVGCVVKSILCLSHHCHGHPTKQNNLKNQIYSNEIGDDHVNQGAKAID
jgi:hypothetical protein